MQTLKTAAIVVLLMTVMYGAYVSLTTPPEPLPAEVQSMLEFPTEESLAIDAGLPESLGELEISMPPASSPLGTGPDFSGTPTMEIASLSNASTESPPIESPPIESMNPGTSSLGGVATTLTDLGGSSAMLPSVSEPQPAATANSTIYPSTGSTFELPDPNSVVSSFTSASQDVAAGSPRDLALASGTTDPNSVGQAPPLGNVQTADLTGATGAPDMGLANALRSADKQYLEDKRRDALATLSIFYNSPNLSGEQRSELLSRLDPLAREVIYSTRHLLEQPHRVGRTETLMDIAAQYDVPWQLLANINQIQDPVTILPGTELKVVRGPFRAEVNLSANELTLFLGDLYAGRFPIAVGDDPAPKAGTYTIQDKQTSKTFYNRAGSPVPPGSPDNPYGNTWLDLGSQLCIHGSPNTTSPTDAGCISLAADYADDLYGILSQGSSVTIRR